MAYRYRSSDGLAQSNDPEAIELWESITARHANARARCSAYLRELGVKMEHPDDGWVDRELNTVTPCYPRFDLKPQPGDVIALGSHSDGYRLVRCTEVTHGGVLVPTVTYSFEDTGRRVDGA